MHQNLRFLFSVAFSASYSVSYLLTEWLPLPLWWYYPLSQSWEFSLSPTRPELVMGWYGKVLNCGLLALGLSLLLTIGLRWQKQKAFPNLQGFLDLTLMSTVVFTLYYLAYTLSQRVISAP